MPDCYLRIQGAPESLAGAVQSGKVNMFRLKLKPSIVPGVQAARVAQRVAHPQEWQHQHSAGQLCRGGKCETYQKLKPSMPQVRRLPKPNSPHRIRCT